MGDNIFETDGAEQSDYQPVTTATIYNFTVIGQPFGANSGDHATAWRDNARVQYHNCIFMDIGDRVVSFDNIDGDGGAGYGFNGTLSWAVDVDDGRTTTYSTVNAPPSPAGFYQAQTSGNLAEITDSVFFTRTPLRRRPTPRRTPSASSLRRTTTCRSRPARRSRRSRARRSNFTIQTTSMRRVLVPRPASGERRARRASASAPNDGFFTPVPYRGALRSERPDVALGLDGRAGVRPDRRSDPGPRPARRPRLALFDVNGALNANGSARRNGRRPERPVLRDRHVGLVDDDDVRGSAEPGHHPARRVDPEPGPLRHRVAQPAAHRRRHGRRRQRVRSATSTFVADGSQPGLLNSMFSTGPTGHVTLTVPMNLPPRRCSTCRPRSSSRAIRSSGCRTRCNSPSTESEFS